jgi:putative F0F1-ATPase subunit (Ca2+/Mg2+ transporter)
MKKEKNDSPMKFYARYSTLGLQMIVIILAGAFGGKAIDAEIDLEFPVFTLVLTLLSVSIAIIYGMRELFKNK